MKNESGLSLFAALLGVVLAAAAADARADSIYKCRDAQGALVYQERPCAKDAQPVSSWNAAMEAPQLDEEAKAGTDSVLVLRQRANGHYFLDGTINGKSLTFVVDTGATAISLPQEAAMSAQVYCREQVLMQTANGTASACLTVIPKLEFGPFRIANVPATIAPGLTQPLLGMSVLRHFRIEQENGEMRISLKR
ncbi:MAG: hypothetical protein A2Z95_05220 [Gallionellales bacterium GWA2_60_18]|nr:MAG: hypothetical protein A2Z95_05220 [Gallionellales bacterium GWA2_60_18]